MTTSKTSPSRHHFGNELPAPRGRTAFLVVVVFAVSLLLTGWIGDKHEDILVARLAAASSVITASHDGRLAEVVAPEGKIINAGGPLVRLEDDALKQEIAAKQAEVDLREVEWRQSVAKAEVDFTWRLRTIEAEVLQTRLKMTELLQQQFDHQIQQQAWKDRLDKIGAATAQTDPEDVFRTASVSRSFPGTGKLEAMIQHEATRNAAEVSRVQLQLCEKRLNELKDLKTQLPSRINNAFGVAGAETRLRSAKSALDALKARHESRNIVSSNYGTVGKYRRRVGEAVKAGETLVEVVDTTKRFLIVDVPANKLTQVLQTKIVHLRFPGGEKFEGKVGGRIDSASNGKDAGTTAVRIEPAGKLWPDIPLGSAVDIVLKPGE